ncbi:MAG TPA: SpoIIE family protein phosphatase [Pilimelia sp.]|nr:SpoIIE family protein phosphatase [Pilimelia sp.]
MGAGFFGFAYAAVVASVWFAGTGPALLSAAVCTVGGRLLLLEPIGPAAGGSPAARWLAFIPVSLLIVVLGRAMWRARERAERAHARADQAARRALLTAGVAAALDAAPTGERAAQALVERVVADMASYAVADLPGVPGVTTAAHRDPAGLAALHALRSEYADTPPEDAARGPVDPTGAVRLVAEAARAAADPRADELLRALGVRSYLCVPLVARGKSVGGLLMGRGDDEPPFTEADLAFARELAARAGLALANIRLREQEHAIAYQLQRTLLPRELPEPDGVSIGACYLPAQAELMIGGDWYDVLELAGGRLGLVVGDVAGHGVGAAAGMGQLRSGLAGLAVGTDEPAALLRQTQRFNERLGNTTFATIALAVFDPQTGSLIYACAGHPPPLVISRTGETTFLWEGRSTPIGLRSAAPRPQAQARLGVGDTLLLYTDGLVELRQEFITDGLDRLAGHARTLADRPVEMLCTELTELMTGDRLSQDDIAVLALRPTRA